MEIIATLEKPFAQSEREAFIFEYNHKLGCVIEENEECIIALDYTPEEKEAQERERIANLSITKSDFFDATIRAFNLDDNDLLPIVSNIVAQVEVPETMKKIAMNNFRNAKDFYRNHEIFHVIANTPIIISEGFSIVLTDEQLDRFFDKASKKDPEAYKELLPTEQPIEIQEEIDHELVADEEVSDNDL